MSQVKTKAVEIVRALRQSGHEAYLVGGCVRDLLLGREPSDYDVATDATPEQVMNIFPQTFAVGAKFGVVLVPVNGADTQAVESRGPATVEVATFRSDGIYSDGRHPDQVRFSSSPQEDAQRRDFTINGLLMDPLQGDRILDFVNGREDLQRGVVRAIGEPARRFSEDKLRMLRAVRFAARFCYQIDKETFAAIRSFAPQIHQVSRERIREELCKMLTEGQARRAFELLDESGLLHEVLPEVEAYKGVEQPPQFHPEGDVWTHTLMLLQGLPAGCSRTLAFGVLLHDVGKPPTFRRAPDRIRFDNHAEVGARMAVEICQRLRMSNDDTEQIRALVANHMKFPELPRMRESTLKRFLRQPAFAEHLELHRLDCLASHGNLDLYRFAEDKLQSIPAKEIRPRPLVTGRHLIAAGYRPGPLFREMLEYAEDAQLEGRIHSPEQGVQLVQERFGAVRES